MALLLEITVAISFQACQPSHLVDTKQTNKQTNKQTQKKKTQPEYRHRKNNLAQSTIKYPAMLRGLLRCLENRSSWKFPSCILHSGPSKTGSSQRPMTLQAPVSAYEIIMVFPCIN
jgi:hypothetical protein